MKNIISFSGGKDSTAMLLMMIEKGIYIDEVIHFSMGDWEWDEMNEHIEKVKQSIPKDIKFTTLSDEERKERDFKKYGFPSLWARWCTGIKEKTITKYLKNNYPNGYTTYLGIAADEKERTENKYKEKYNVEYPLVDWGITEEEALEYCYSLGYDWGGLYKEKPSKRLSCWCCPLQRMDDLRFLYTAHYEKWKELREMQKLSWTTFKMDGRTTIYSIEHKFWLEGLDGMRKKLRPKKNNVVKQDSLFK